MNARPFSVVAELRIYAGMFRMKFIEGLQYRAAAFAGIATQFCWGFMLLAVYWAFYQSSSADQGMSYPELASYIWLQQGLLALVMLWFGDAELYASITGGTVAYELCRPVSLYGLWFGRLLGDRLSRTALRVFPVILVASLLPHPFTLLPPPTAQAAALFVVALALSALLVVAISMFMYALTFITLSPAGGTILIGMIGQFLSGALLPLALMPGWLQFLLRCLPFAYMQDFPLRVYSGNIAGGEALLGIGLQLLWLATLIPLGMLCFRKVLRRAVIQGG